MGVKFTAPRRLEDDESLAGFDCGAAPINIWADKWAAKARSRGTAVVYISFDVDGPIAGFYSLSNYSIKRAHVKSRTLKRNTPEEIPAVLLGMLGVDVAYQGCGLGAALLADAVARALKASESIGAKALLVKPIDEAAANFYKNYGFKDACVDNLLYISLRL